MDNFIVSARKYRPATFNSVVGQKSITSTLKNSIKNNHLAHAYLFCGPRGVGKTTCARIFAKTINCQNINSDFEACNECESCKSFNENRSYNIHELDAASNNSVEDIRTLIEQVRIPPQIGTHSVYIIDEVHMLSSQAFNAFLKTLEEPPKHAIFVLATTEKHKILPTILSRCQIYDFNRIKVEDAVSHLAYVAEKEGIDADRDALNVIAGKADGAMRDALSFFDQIVSFSGKKITYDDAIENLNILDYDYYFKLVDSFLEKDFINAFLILDEILAKGFDGHRFISGLSTHLRDILVCKNPETVDLIEVGDNIKEKYIKQAKECNENFLFKAIEISNQTDLEYRNSQNKRLQLELALMKISNINKPIIEDKSIGKKEKVEIIENPKQEVSKEPAIEKKEKSVIKDSGISLKIKKEQPKEEKPIETENKNTKNEIIVSETALNQAWKNLVESLNSKTPRLYNVLKPLIPKIEDNEITISVTTEIVLNSLNKIKTKFIDFLKTKTENNNIKLNIILEENKEENKTIHTKKDKFEYLKKNNDNFEKFINTFDLDY